MLGMSLSMSPSLAQRQVQRLSLTLAQRIAIKSRQTLLRIELVATLREENYTPKAHCPNCHRELQANEILAGFRDDVNDFTTQCTGCQHRFEPKLVCFGTRFSMEIPFFCDVQAQYRLAKLAHLPPSEIAREHPGEYRSAVIHHGTLSAMFAKMDIPYHHNELEGWQGKVLPFLGRMPDTVIAMCVNSTSKVVRRLRKAHNIGKYTKQKALREIKK